MFAYAAAALLLQSSDFTISDTTDNETGIRTVYAVQLDVDEIKRMSFMKLECVDHRPSVIFEFYDFTAPEWAVVALGGGDSSDTPFIFHRNPDRDSELVLYGEANDLIGRLSEGSVRRFIAYASHGTREASFGMTGLAGTWQRVSAACR
jgi:hypothetical protein